MKEKKNASPKGWILLSICFLILVGAVLAYVSSRSPDAVQQRSVTWTDAGFDTPVTFSATATQEDFDKYAAVVKETFVEYNALFDQYNDYEGINNVKTLNEEAASHPVETDQALVDLITEAETFTEANSKFDITEGRILALWHDARESETPVLPSQEEIDAAKEHTGIEGITIDGTSISFSDDSISLDLGAIAKGWTAGVAAEKVQAMGLDNGFINAGGNVVLLGAKTDGSDWVIGIQSPDESDSVVQFVTSVPVAMVTSGDYQRYLEVDGVRYSHIIDPDTGWPVSYVRSVTVIGPDSGAADANSTTLFLLPLEESMAYAEKNGIQAVWITDKGQEAVEPDLQTELYDIYITDGLKDSIQLTQ